MIKRCVLVSFLSLFMVSVSFGQIQKIDEASFGELEKMGKALVMPQQDFSDRLISVPSVPRGCLLELKGSDKLSVVNSRREIGNPITEQDVKLFFTLRELKTGNQVEITHLGVTIPAKEQFEIGANEKPIVIPSLREWVGFDGSLAISPKGTITLSPQVESSFLSRAELFASDLNEMFGFTYKVKVSDKPGDIHFSWSKDQSLEEEGYRISIVENIKIEGLTPEALFWGTRSILQLLVESENSISKGVIRDYPKYAKRGFMLDCGRKFISYKFLQDYLKICSFYKMNDLHIHLNDNGFKQFFDNDWDKTYWGFRLESDYFPELTSKDGHYTKDEFRQLQLDGMELGVNVIPEIDVPAHSLAFSRYRKSLGSEKYGMDHLDIQKPETYQFVDSLFYEYLGGDNPVFVGPDVHIGTDEYSKTEAEQFRTFIDHYLRYIQSFGKRPRFWGSLSHAEGKTPIVVEDVLMNVWYNDYSDPRKAIDMGYQVTSIPDGLTYIVPAAGYYYDYLNIPYIYSSWEPTTIGNQTFADGHSSIEGGAFAVWNDHVGNGISEKDIHHRSFPAMQVFAEKMWHGVSSRSFELYNEVAGMLPEAPGVNILGRVKSDGATILHYNFANRKIEDISKNGYELERKEGIKFVGSAGISFVKGSLIETAIEEIGYGYKVDFTINRVGNVADSSVLFESEYAQLFLTSGANYQIGFKRDGYRYLFSHKFQRGESYSISIDGDNKGTSLYIDDKLIERLEGNKFEITNSRGKIEKLHLQQTLQFPLRYIGGESGTFVGTLKELKVVKR